MGIDGRFYRFDHQSEKSSVVNDIDKAAREATNKVRKENRYFGLGNCFLHGKQLCLSELESLLRVGIERNYAALMGDTA